MEPINPPLSDSPQTTSQEPIQPPPPSNRSLPQPKKNSPKILLIVIVLVLLSISGVAGYMIYRNLSGQGPEQTACTLEAKVCPDGSSVGRSGPSCEFAPCPTQVPVTTKTYTSEREGFNFDYPSNWKVNESDLTECSNGDEGGKRVEITSPNRTYSVLYIDRCENIDKIPCGTHAVCPVENILGIEILQTSSLGEIMLIKLDHGKAYLHKPLSDDTIPKIGESKYSNYSIDYGLPSKTNSRYAIYLTGPFIEEGSLDYFEEVTAKQGLDTLRSFKFTDQTPTTSPIPNEYMGHKVCQTDSECTSDEKCLEVGPGAIKPPVKTCWREESLPQ